jgi:hypothetical protein
MGVSWMPSRAASPAAFSVPGPVMPARVRRPGAQPCAAAAPSRHPPGRGGAAEQQVQHCPDLELPGGAADADGVQVQGAAPDVLPGDHRLGGWHLPRRQARVPGIFLERVHIPVAAGTLLAALGGGWVQPHDLPAGEVPQSGRVLHRPAAARIWSASATSASERSAVCASIILALSACVSECAPSPCWQADTAGMLAFTVRGAHTRFTGNG